MSFHQVPWEWLAIHFYYDSQWYNEKTHKRHLQESPTWMTPNSPEWNWHDFSIFFVRFSPPTTACQRFLSFTFSFEAGSKSLYVAKLTKILDTLQETFHTSALAKGTAHLQKYLLEGISYFCRRVLDLIPSKTLLDTFEKIISFEEIRFDQIANGCVFSSLFLGVLLPWPPRPFATSFPWHPFGLVSSVRSLGEEGSHDVPHGMHHHLTWKAELLLLLVLEDQKGQVGNCEVVMCFFLVMSDVKTQHPKQVQNLNLLRILKVVGALKRKRQKDAILCDFQSISISLTLPACWAMLGLALCCFPSQTETCNKKEVRIWFLGSSESFPTKFLWPKLDVKIFLFLFHALWPDSRLPCFQAHACIKCRLGPAWHSDSSEKRMFGSTEKTWVDPTGEIFRRNLPNETLEVDEVQRDQWLVQEGWCWRVGESLHVLEICDFEYQIASIKSIVGVISLFFLRRLSKLGGIAPIPM